MMWLYKIEEKKNFRWGKSFNMSTGFKQLLLAQVIINLLNKVFRPALGMKPGTFPCKDSVHIITLFISHTPQNQTFSKIKI